jgi:hypothetical protein
MPQTKRKRSNSRSESPLPNTSRNRERVLAGLATLDVKTLKERHLDPIVHLMKAAEQRTPYMPGYMAKDSERLEYAIDTIGANKDALIELIITVSGDPYVRMLKTYNTAPGLLTEGPQHRPTLQPGAFPPSASPVSSSPPDSSPFSHPMSSPPISPLFNGFVPKNRTKHIPLGGTRRRRRPKASRGRR